ncbi:MAG: hypothetical protein JWQ33_1475 [Ramlibacter sp.]|nr:hypothetical protein [Ramlibacter sp.]
MSRVIRLDQFLPVEKSKFLSALEAASLEVGRFEVAKMEITPPLMPGRVSALVTVKLVSSAIAFSYEESPDSSWVGAFEDDLRAGRFVAGRVRPQPVSDAADSEPAAT